MTEKKLVISNRTIQYNGLFSFPEMLTTINNALDKLGYQKQEKKTEEKTYPTGRDVYIELRPFKEKTNYTTLMIKIKITLHNITETIKEIDRIKRKYQQGEVTVTFDAWLVTDYEKRWGMKPWFFFLKGFIHKYFYSFPLESGFTNELSSDIGYLSAQIQSLSNLYKQYLSGSSAASPRP